MLLLGDFIDKVSDNRDNLLLLIKERKNKKKGCDHETLLKECWIRFNMDENDFKTAINKLKNIGCIKEVTRAGKVTYSLQQSEIPTANFHTNNEDMFSDFVDFKIYITETLCSLNEKIEKLDSSLEMKDVVINLLREELKNAKENLKIALEQNTELIKNHPFSVNVVDKIDHLKVVKKVDLTKDDNQNGVTKVVNLKEIIDDIPLDKSIINNDNEKPNDYYTLDNQMSRFRQKMHENFNSHKSESVVTVEKKVKSKGRKDSKSVVKENEVGKKRHNVIVCGDSMLNNIEGNGLSSKSVKVTVKNFPGADTQDMTDFIKPLLKKSPKSLVVHAGTNDITSGCNTLENLESI